MRLTRSLLLNRRIEQGTWHRAVHATYVHQPLAFQHTSTTPGRFNPGSSQRPAIPVLYLTQTPLVAQFEVGALLGSPLRGQAFAPNPNPQHWTIIPVDVRLRVADLSRAGQRRLIETTAQELTGDWRSYYLRNPNPALNPPHWTNIPTQRLGSALYGVRGLDGFIVHSAKAPVLRNLVVFPDKLRAGSFVRCINPTTGQTHQIGP
jgi:hypothetical protein